MRFFNQERPHQALEYRTPMALYRESVALKRAASEGRAAVAQGGCPHRLLEKLGVGHFSAMGMSSGGMTLLHMATSQPKRIESMVLISATSHFPDSGKDHHAESFVWHHAPTSARDVSGVRTPR
ncbi:alpha/beta fold hydrolase [Corallococcus sp. CA047B]|uniref:alpha/beta fold hydrolase n=1 Tax=Corallococcus sp. CA047B TaxID=2316729 RepID=UPI00351A553B